MSKRQADYLSSLLSNDPTPAPQVTPPAQTATSAPSAPPPAEAPRTPNPKSTMTLLARESALARVATGEVKQVTQLLLDPARVRIWQGNPRHQGTLNEDNCRDLIDAILAEGGQKVAAIVRRVTNDPTYEYEVIAGSRRHWAISWLRANNYPEMMFLAQVHSLDDEAAFRLSDIENRARKDVSDFERARTYLQALDEHYNGKQSRMAERLRLSKGWLSKMLSVAALPQWAVDAFASPADIQLKTCYPLAQKIQSLSEPDSAAQLRQMKDAANRLQTLQSGSGALPSAEVVKRLIHAADTQAKDDETISYETAYGRTALSILSANRNGVSVRLHAGSGATEAELIEMLKSALRTLESKGKGLQA
ncbi:MAG: ParB/RepB/Spo0J family partition protein [Asticcacaulis sp.]